MPTFYNPENALKRANEFSEIGKEEEALECLYDALKNRKCRMIKQVHEDIINKFLELCVKYKKSQTAKDGLYSYRNLCQGVNAKSWEDSICKYLQLAENNIEDVQEMIQTFILEVDDLDQDITPELLLKSVSNEGSQARTERVMLFPSIKFLWECYRNCLDLLRNTQTDKLYHTVAQTAFKFCVKFCRRSELRKLCCILRMHAAHVQKRQFYSKMDESEIQLLFLETGFVELESAMSMELWQDAFKAVEDIHSVLSISKKFQHSRIMAHYFDKIACVFLKGGEYLYHAAAVLRHFILVRDQKKNLNVEDIAKLASRVLISILAIPFATNNPVIDLISETDVSVIDRKHRLLSNLLDLHKCPTRAALIKDVIRLNIFQLVSKEFEDLFHVIEYEIEPAKISFHISKIINFVDDSNGYNLEQYMPLVQKNAIIRLLSALSNIYTNMKLQKLLSLSGFSEIYQLEIIIAESARRYHLPLRIDHRNECVYFSLDFNFFQTEKPHESDTNLFPMENFKYMMHINSKLANVVKQIYPERNKNKNKMLVSEIASQYVRKREKYHKELLGRKYIIEKHKETMENMRLQKDAEEKKLVAEKLLKLKAAEKKRLLGEIEERNLRRLQREREEIKRKMVLEKMEALKQSDLGCQIVENFEIGDLNNLDSQILFCKQIEQLNKERKELSSRLLRQEKKFYHLERAKRVEEAPLLIVQYDEKRLTDLKMWKENEGKKLENAFIHRAQELQKKKRMLMIKEDLEKFLESVKRNRQDTYIEQREEFLKTLEEERVKRLKDRRDKRKMQRKAEWSIRNNLMQKLEEERSFLNKIIYDDTPNANIKKKKDNDALSGTMKDIDSNYILPPRNTVSITIEKQLTARPCEKYYNESSSCRTDSKEQTKLPSSNIPSNFSNKSYLIEDTRHYTSKYEAYAQEIQQAERYERKVTFDSISSSLNYTKVRSGDNYRSSYSSSNYKVRTTGFEKSEESASRRASHTDFTYPNRWRRFEEEPVPQRTILIRRRDTKSEMSPSGKQTRGDMNTETFSNNVPPEKGSETGHSCTPWAKSKRETSNT